jgi:chromosome segregation ATPase
MDDPVISLIQSLSREVGSLSREVGDLRQEMRSGFERIEQATRRHSTAIAAGTFSIGGLNKAIERVEALVHDRDQQIAELRDRVRALEQKQGG